jgi:hypothetical protein
MRKLLTGLWILAFCAVTTLLFAASGAAQGVELLPNLQPFPAFNLSIEPNFSTGGKQIRFSTRSWNKGTGPLELVAGETGPEGQHVYQRVYSSDGSHQDYFVGRFEWHPSHNHFHFQDYALYYLEPINAPGGSVKSGTKTTFCVMDTNKINGSLPGAPQNAVYATCGAQVQGMSVGWADTYGSQLTGQSVDFTGNPSGDYCLTIMIDPKGRLLESNEGDNVSSTLLRVDAERSTVTVLNIAGCTPTTPTGGDVVIDSFQPTSATTGSTVTLSITGSGFAPGMAVTFGGGSGPPPTVSDVRVVDSSTIEATVTIKKGKIGKDPVWDLRVGSAVWANAFTVER